jgi:serine/threonine protein kinase
LTNGYYRNLTDIWSTGKHWIIFNSFENISFLPFKGCVMYEIITLQPLFPGTNELDQINKIHDVLGTPSHSTLEKFQQ